MWFLIVWFALVISSLIVYYTSSGLIDEEFEYRVARDMELRAAHDWYVEAYGRTPTAAELWEVVPPIE